ncbi:MAG: hypothetical protein ACOC0O_03265 [Spirochaetota bacterium]
MVLHAVNDYEVAITLEELQEIGHLVALGEDGPAYHELPDGRNKGDAAIAIDFSEHDRLEIEVYEYHLAWWLDHVEIR